MCKLHKITLDKCVDDIYNNVEDTNRSPHDTVKQEVTPLTEQDKQNVETLVDIINRLPAEDKRVLEAYARGVVDKTTAQQPPQPAGE